MQHIQTNTTREEAYEFIRSHAKLALSMIDGKGVSTTSLMHFALAGNDRLLIGTRKSFHKYEILKTNSQVSFLIIEKGEDPIQAVSGQGVATELSDSVLGMAHNIFKEKNTSTWYVEGSDDFVMFQIVIKSLRWHDARTGTLVVTDIPVQIQDE